MSDMEKNPGSKAGRSDVRHGKEPRQQSRRVRCQTGKRIPAEKPAGQMSDREKSPGSKAGRPDVRENEKRESPIGHEAGK